MSKNKRLALIIRLAEAGLLNTEIAVRVGLKKARVSQIIKESGRLDLCGYDRRRNAHIPRGKRRPKTRRTLPTKDYLLMALTYDPLGGTFHWNARADRPSRWSTRHAGKPAGGVNRVLGYYEIRMDGDLLYGHQIAWIYSNGEIPEGMTIDHINRIKTDNRLSNLRLATHAQNVQNRLYPPKKSGLPIGVSARSGRFEAQFAGKTLGRFVRVEEAAAARQSAAIAKYGDFIPSSPSTK